jgi:hypothetical protein
MKRRMTRRWVAAIVGGSFLLCWAPAKAYAQVTTFTSLQAWKAAAKSDPSFRGFERDKFRKFTRDRYFQTSGVRSAFVSFRQVGQDPTFGYFENFIDVPPLQFTDNSGVTNAAMYTKFGLVTVEMTFHKRIFAWGANFFDAQTGELENLILTAPDGSAIATIPVTVNTGFFGFVTDPSQEIKAITFESQIDNPDPSVGQGFGLENLVGAFVKRGSR